MKVAMLVMLTPILALAQSESCDRFSFAVSKTKLASLPVTVLRGGLSPVLEIAGKTYAYDVGTHCLNDTSKMSEAANASRDCSKPLKVMNGNQVVAVIEGQGRVTIAPADAKGKRDFSQASYSVFVARDVSSPSRPRFVIEARSPEGKTLGRLDGIEGMTSGELTKFKAKLASSHGLIDLRGKDLVWANCRKLAVTHSNDAHSNMLRMVASARAETSSRSLPATLSANRAMASSTMKTRAFPMARSTGPINQTVNYGSMESASVAPPEYAAPPVGSFSAAPPPSMQVPSGFESAPPPSNIDMVSPSMYPPIDPSMNPMKR